MSGEEKQDLAAEQAADLAALQAAAAPPAPQGPRGDYLEPGERMDEVLPPSAAAMAMAATIVGVCRPLAAYAMPALRGAPDELWEPVPEGVAAVLDHAGASAEWMRSPWARLAMSLVPLVAYAAAAAMQEKPREALEAAPAPGAPAEPGAATVSFGTVAPEGAPA